MDYDALHDILEDKGLSHSEIEAVLEHAGVKGMRWGVRKDKSTKQVMIGRPKRSKTEVAEITATGAAVAATLLLSLATYKMSK